jgi:hypothetical protein
MKYLLLFGLVALMGCGLNEPLEPDCDWFRYELVHTASGSRYSITVSSDLPEVWLYRESDFDFFTEAWLTRIDSAYFGCIGVHVTENISIAMGLSPEGPWCPLK